MVHFSTGTAIDAVSSPSYQTNPGFKFNTSQAQDPALYKKASCSKATSMPLAQDLTEFKVALTVPTGATSFSIDYNFLTAEYPQYLCTAYTDRFAVGLVRGTVTTNIALVAGEPITPNLAQLSICASFSGENADMNQVSHTCSESVSALTQTGYGVTPTGSTAMSGAATGWRTLSASVTAGETIALRFVVLDEGDATNDSAVLLDNFSWH